MNPDSDRRDGFPRQSHLLLAAVILILLSVILVACWQLSPSLPMLRKAPTAPAQTPHALPAITPKPSATPWPAPTLTPTPVITQPVITGSSAEADDRSGIISFHLAAQVPPSLQIAEVLLWYDTERGHQLQRFDGPLPYSITLSYQLDAAREGLTRTLTTTSELDYWWLVRDTAGESVRAGGSVTLGPLLQAMVATPAPEPPPTNFVWATSQSPHFKFFYMPGTAAERDIAQISRVAEASLARITPILQVQFDGQMDIYLVPHVFWQGGATYGNKQQLISYLDRNYTDIETWSYFTHEGTHALAQDFIQPKEAGGPDGVLVEGLAVWASGGHYRQEPIDAWAAVIAGSTAYIPLEKLRAGPFYDFQHETAYMEAASFVKFLMDNYGLDKFKELYGQATGDATHDNTLATSLYGEDYAQLEANWLTYLAQLQPTAEQARTWQLRVRSFDLMRRYETELDPDARVLPGNAPPEWTSDTLKIFLPRTEPPLNIELETSLISVQERLVGGDLDGAEALLNDIQAVLDAPGILDRPSLQARQAILDLVAEQDQAVLTADLGRYLKTLTPAYAGTTAGTAKAELEIPFTEYRQEIVQLEVADDGQSAQGRIVLHAQVAGGLPAGDGQLFSLTFARTQDGWLMSNREPYSVVLALPPPVTVSQYETVPMGLLLDTDHTDLPDLVAAAFFSTSGPKSLRAPGAKTSLLGPDP